MSCRSNNSVMAIVERTQKCLSETFAKYQQKVSHEACEAVRRVMSKDPPNIMEASNTCRLLCRNRKKLRKEGFLSVALFLTILLFFLLGLHLVRVYHRTCAYGEGGCLSTGFWFYEECQIVT
ncbi:uncharacterized protein Dana_GF27892 [Drosophila ananassae]|uniref:Uncharacterized protein n=1 Tax=Drosophila ananassae TaxID=7217 RepID=A0A0P8YG66_DROAN|nr:uncharacterized protein LOC26515301 [Drosophila ananassae]KPU77930.1 uncharacterized protein Dana_GF27892 [Drosophila ananassae]